jgi:predicted SprT family Zn-dependent metalloprotease
MFSKLIKRLFGASPERSNKMAKRRKKSKLKYTVKCGKRTISRHRKKSAAKRAKPARKGCRVIGKR